MIEQKLKEQILDANNIVDVIGQFVTLRKKVSIIWAFALSIRTGIHP